MACALLIMYIIYDISVIIKRYRSRNLKKHALSRTSIDLYNIFCTVRTWISRRVWRELYTSYGIVVPVLRGVTKTWIYYYIIVHYRDHYVWGRFVCITYRYYLVSYWTGSKNWLRLSLDYLLNLSLYCENETLDRNFRSGARGFIRNVCFFFELSVYL